MGVYSMQGLTLGFRTLPNLLRRAMWRRSGSCCAELGETLDVGLSEDVPELSRTELSLSFGVDPLVICDECPF